MDLWSASPPLTFSNISIGQWYWPLQLKNILDVHNYHAPNRQTISQQSKRVS